MNELKFYKNKEYAYSPKLHEVDSIEFDIQAAFQMGDKIRTYNPWNKECLIPVKNIGGKVGFQLHPENRAQVPTGLIFDIPEGYSLKMYMKPEVALKKGLVLANGTTIISYDLHRRPNDELYMVLYNVSDSLVVVNEGEILTAISMELACEYSLSESVKVPV
jgi:dUTPase